jgi:hypothetical protein
VIKQGKKRSMNKKPKYVKKFKARRNLKQEERKRRKKIEVRKRRKKTKKERRLQQSNINGNLSTKTKHYGHIHRVRLWMMIMVNFIKHQPTTRRNILQ